MTLRENDPESVGGYRIESRIGTGGMGVVYLGRSASGRAVAVKVVHTRYADNPEFRARFRQEIAAARRVSGAFTAPVVDADPEAARPWMATAFVPGRTLAELVDESGPLDWPALRRLGTELAEALREIHRAEVVHRDLKPSNVLLLDSEGDDGAVRVIDFGISRAADSDVRTQTGMVMGSPPFMAPEQFSRPHEVGSAVDVFSLGAVLVYAATGHSPFEAENAYLAAYNTVHGEPRLGELPARLRPLVARCLAKEPADRPTASEVLQLLAGLPEELPEGEPAQEVSAAPRMPVTDVVTSPLGDPAAPARRGRRGRRLWAAVAVVALLGGAGAAAAAVVGGEPASTVDGFDALAPRTTAPGGTAPAGWRPWHNALGSDGMDAQTGVGTSCTPDALGVFCASGGTALMRLDPATGNVEWTKSMSRKEVSSFTTREPVVHDGVVFVYSADRSQGIDAYDGKTGERRWRLKGPLGEFECLGGVLLVRLDELGLSETARYAAYEPRTGKELWRRELTSTSPSPFYEGPKGTLYADLRGGEGGIARLDARTGRTLGSVDAPKGDLWLATVHDGTAYYARWEDDSGVSAAFFVQDLGSGRTRRIDFPWSVEPEAPPLVQGDTMYIFDYGNETLLALDVKRGKPLWSSSRDLRVFSEPAYHEGRLYVTMPDTSVLALDPATGKEIGRTAPSFDTAGRSFEELSPSSTPPLLVGNVLYGVSGPGVFSVADVS
ncbi:outer membrane protein assembly factor BamB [Streptomyces sp. SAI-208]|uniref:protein kinase domain-containing protein n=1 Tax=unclassified Streptomyces TaxID=2593676 RepID=UPI002473D7F8|nr:MULTISPECIES: PQQ-binding-like beta-propeller repeat protein [unclassified Streptomyces]MDH6553155.1 outer membrane protein assembly factor BamB [Streptomyces sp. SAI-041]MDH6611930.1 outer membrane protein assembly factor BamB [Streptomyces sp. SAI-208]